MGCVFCASGQAGLDARPRRRARSSARCCVARRHLEPGEELRNLVFMGMGEPLHHYDETARALRLLTHPEGGGMSPRRITVSTVGLIPGIKKLGEDFGGQGRARRLAARAGRRDARPHHADEQAVPAGRADRRRCATIRCRKRRRITIEYTLIDGVNDRIEHAERLSQLLRRLPVKVNLIPMNPIDGFRSSRASRRPRVDAFQGELARPGVQLLRAHAARRRRERRVRAARAQTRAATLTLR